MSSTLDEILRSDSKQFWKDFEEASIKYKTPDDIAQFREESVRKFLKKYFPPSHQIGKGEIIDTKGNRSSSIDAIICNAYHPFTVAESGIGLFFAEGVKCAIEVKSDLSNKDELQRGIIQVQKTKKLERVPLKGDILHTSPYSLEKIKKICTILFGYKGPQGKTLKENIMEINAKLGIPVNEQLDAVILLDKGILYNIKDAQDSLVVEFQGKRQLGLVGVSSGEFSLRDLLFYISHIPQEIRSSPIIQLYAGILGDKRKVNLIL